MIGHPCQYAGTQMSPTGVNGARGLVTPSPRGADAAPAKPKGAGSSAPAPVGAHYQPDGPAELAHTAIWLALAGVEVPA